MSMLKKRFLLDKNPNGFPFHPCVHPIANRKLARIHLPVAKNCNLICRYCFRQHPNSKRNLPGTSNGVMSPEQALNHLCRQRKIWGRNAIVGISGPGEPLANPETFETLRLVKTKFRSHPMCLCTNGLLLRDRVDDLYDIGMSVISITINGVNPKIVKILQPGIKLGKVLPLGEKAAICLIKAQMEGLKMAVARNMFVKVNTVVAEEINDGHLMDLARIVADIGAGMMNIMPVIPPHAKSPLKPPDRVKIETLRNECEKVIPQFRLCRQCSSDAAGIPGQMKKGGCCL